MPKKKNMNSKENKKLPLKKRPFTFCFVGLQAVVLSLLAAIYLNNLLIKLQPLVMEGRAERIYNLDAEYLFCASVFIVVALILLLIICAKYRYKWLVVLCAAASILGIGLCIEGNHHFVYTIGKAPYTGMGISKGIFISPTEYMWNQMGEVEIWITKVSVPKGTGTRTSGGASTNYHLNYKIKTTDQHSILLQEEASATNQLAKYLIDNNVTINTDRNSDKYRSKLSYYLYGITEESPFIQ